MSRSAGCSSATAAMRARLALQRPLTADDGAGGLTTTWQDVTALWAAIRPLRGSEGHWLDAPAGSLTSEVTIRWRAGVRPDMRLVGDGRVFDIRAVFDPDGRRRRLVCHCLERPL